MKKIFALLVAAVIAVSCSVAAFAAGSYPSPTAPTIVPSHPHDPETITGPSVNPVNPPGPNNPEIVTSTTTPGGGGGTTPGGSTTSSGSGSATKPGDGLITGTTGLTTPDGSTITATVKPDTNPNAPETGETSSEVFAFAAVAMIGATVTVMLRKKKDDDAQ